MKKILLIFLLLIPTLQVIYAQNVNYLKSWGGANAKIQHSAKFTDSLGNSICVGSFSGIVDIDPGASIKMLTSTGLNDIFVLKLNSLGNHIWSKQFGGKNEDASNGVATDKWGNSYVSGWFKDSLNIGQFKLKSKGEADTYLYKIDKNGVILWAYVLATTDKVTNSNQVTFDQNQKIIIAGGFGLQNGPLSILNLDGSTADTMEIFGNTRYPNLSGYYIAEVDSMGRSKLKNYIWVSSDKYSVQAQNIKFDKNNLSFQVSNFKEFYFMNVINGNGFKTSKGKTDFVLQKESLSSQPFWGNHIGGIGTDSAYALVIDENSNIYITGSFEDVVNFDEGASNTTLTSSGLSDAFVAKFDSSGKFKWVKQFGGTKSDVGKSLYYQKDKGLFLGGYFSEKMKVNINGNNTTLTSSGLFTGFVSKIDTSGTISWIYTHKGNGNSTINSVEYTHNNKLTISGEYTNTIDFGFGFSSNPNWVTSSAGNVDGFVENISIPFSIPTFTTNGNDELPIKIYPNPNAPNGKIFISNVPTTATITIHDVHGNLMQTIEISNRLLDLDLKGIPSGVYSLKLISVNLTQIEKLVIE